MAKPDLYRMYYADSWAGPQFTDCRCRQTLCQQLVVMNQAATVPLRIRESGKQARRFDFSRYNPRHARRMLQRTPYEKLHRPCGQGQCGSDQYHQSHDGPLSPRQTPGERHAPRCAK